jgi:FtsP/CotA-like multicopper oxidase with cupredoxin domain
MISQQTMTRWILITGALALASCRSGPVPLPDPPDARARDGVATLTLTATRGANGRDTFAFEGRDAPPTIRVSPGDVLKIHYVNALPVAHDATTHTGQMNMTNLHFHGLAVSPERPQDDVVDMVAMPGEALDYTVIIPNDHPPGLNWYHTHPHGESHQQVLDGMSGALVVEGIERYAPDVRMMRERILVIRAADIAHDQKAPAVRARVEVPRAVCGESHDEVDRVFTVNGVLRPEIAIQPGERQFWRIVNAASDRYLDVELSGGQLDVIAYDGLPIAYHDPAHPVRRLDHVLLPPAGRVEAIVSGQPNGIRSVLRTRCVDTGRDGDPNPGMILADVASAKIAPQPTTPTAPPAAAVSEAPTQFKVVDAERLKREPPRFVAAFSEDRNGFYINGQKYAADMPPMARAKVGGYEHWRILNNTRELHPMHIHQAHFLAFLENDRPMPDPEWLDTVNVPVGGSVDVIMDFTNPVIRGMSLFHCHLLNHEDKGMMAKILFE